MAKILQHVKCEGNPCANCLSHNHECTFVQQTKKRPIRKDHKYIAKIEDDNKRLDEYTKRLETALGEAAPDVYEALKPNDRRLSGGLPRDARQRPAKTVPLADTLSRPVTAGSFLFGDGMKVGAYIGVIPCLILLTRKDRHHHGPFCKKLDLTPP